MRAGSWAPRQRRGRRGAVERAAERLGVDAEPSVLARQELEVRVAREPARERRAYAVRVSIGPHPLRVRDLHGDALVSAGTSLDAIKIGERELRHDIQEHANADVDEAPTLYLALAAIGWEYGHVDATVKARALAVIDDPRELERWPDTMRAGRKKTLEALRAKLSQKPPKTKIPRRKRPVEAPSHEVSAPDGSAMARAFEIGDGKTRLGQVMISVATGGGGVFAAAARSGLCDRL